MARKLDDKIRQARMLYCNGGTCEDVARAMDVAESTVYRWKDADRKRGTDWDKRRSEVAFDPSALISLLEKRLVDVAKRDDLDDYARAQSVQMLTRSLQGIRDQYGDIGMRVYALDDFTKWCVRNMTDDEREVILRAVEGYLDELKRSATT